MLSTFRKGVSLLPAAFRRRDLLGRWLAGAHRTQFVLVVTGALVVFSLPPLLDWALPKLYPPVRSKVSVLGIPAFSTSRPDPRVAERREQLLLAVWVLWLAATGVMLVTELPRAVAKDGVEPAAGTSGPPKGVSANATASDPGATVIESPDPGRTVIESGGEAPAAPNVVESTRRGPGDRYQITRELGRGGMGVVYHAVDSVLQREVALKELPLHLGAQSELAMRFRQEARVLAKLAHPCIVQVHDLIEDDGRLWIALEYVRGGTLADAMRYNGGALSWTETVRIGRQIADGLHFAHAQGVIHRDIKPMNVLVTDAHPPVAKLTDFGLARLTESTEHTQPGSILGSARYMSPEQVAGKSADARSDLYALGVTFFEMLAGRVPFEGEFTAVLGRHANEIPPDLRTVVPDVPAVLADLVASMLAKSPDDRPADAGVVAITLGSLAADATPMQDAA